ncbi:MAG TPA: hypothetical protein VGE07_26950 [Herpetosiphonaceae bacterium]
MLTFKDFIPQIQKRVLGMPTAYESIHEVLTRVNRWLEHERLEVISIETLLLPKLPGEAEESPPARMTAASSSMGTFQVIRVWCREPAGGARAYTGVTQQLSPLDQDQDA